MPEPFGEPVLLCNAKDTIRMLDKHCPAAKESVRRAMVLWNKPIRDILRSESGFRLGRQDDNGKLVSISIPVLIDDGLPIQLDDALKPLQGLEWLLAARPLLNDTKEGLNFLKENQDNIALTLSRINASNPTLSSGDYNNCIKLIDALQYAVEQTNTLDACIKEIDSDVFGAFFFNRQEHIELYWVAIAIFSLHKNIDPEALTIVVLAHELAHAYTLSGSDIDGGVWNKNAINTTDIEIIEGIAQYYTEVVCERLYGRYPNAKKAFDALLSVQNEIYTGYTNWYPDDKQTGEAMRASILDCRLLNITTEETFKSVIIDNLQGKPNKSHNIYNDLFDSDFIREFR